MCIAGVSDGPTPVPTRPTRVGRIRGAPNVLNGTYSVNDTTGRARSSRPSDRIVGPGRGVRAGRPAARKLPWSARGEPGDDDVAEDRAVALAGGAGGHVAAEEVAERGVVGDLEDAVGA